MIKEAEKRSGDDRTAFPGMEPPFQTMPHSKR